MASATGAGMLATNGIHGFADRVDLVDLLGETSRKDGIAQVYNRTNDIMRAMDGSL